MHQHQWDFAEAPSGWAATCACGVAVAVDERRAGAPQWQWTRHGQPVPAERMVKALASVERQLMTRLWPAPD